MADSTWWAKQLAPEPLSAILGAHTFAAEGRPLRDEARVHLKDLRDTLAHRRLTHTHSPFLRQVVSRLRMLETLIHDHLPAGTHPIPLSEQRLALLRDLLNQSETFLDRVREQLVYAVHLELAARDLGRLLVDLFQNGFQHPDAIAYDSFVELVRPWMRRNPLHQLTLQPIPLERIVLEELHAGVLGTLPVQPLITGIVSCWSVLQTLQRASLDREQILTLAVAALLQDVGFLVLHTARTEEQQKFSRFDDCPQHPTVGAAFIAGLQGTPAAVTRWIAEHHERLDGSGTPRRRRGAELCASSCFLAAATRLWELRRAQDPWEVLTRLQALPGHGPEVALLREAEAGEFDRQAVEQLIVGTTGNVDGESSATVREAAFAMHALRGPHFEHTPSDMLNFGEYERDGAMERRLRFNMEGIPSFMRGD